MKYYIPLLGGIGNMIQQIPFMLTLKEMKNEVVAIRWSIDFLETLDIMNNCFNELVDKNHNFSDGIGPFLNNKYNGNIIPEHQGWYYAYNIPYPGINNVRFEGLYSNYLDHIPVDIVIAPTCKRNWPMKMFPHWKQVIKIFTDIGYNVVLVGKKGDGGTLTNEKVTDLRGKTSLKDLAGLMRRAQVTVANEGGLAHLSCLMGTKTIILIGGSGVVKNNPVKNFEHLSVGMSCQPCLLNGAFIDNQKNPPIFHGCKPQDKEFDNVRCLQRLKPEIVAKTAMRYINAKNGRH